MNAVQLLNPNGSPSGVWACGKCGSLHGHTTTKTGYDSEFNLQRAQVCCDRRCLDCNAPLERLSPYAVCRGCLPRRDERQRNERFKKATKLTVEEWGKSGAGPMLYSEILDRWFDDLDGVDEWVEDGDEDEPRERPAYLWCTVPMKWEPDVGGDLADQMHDNLGEDTPDQIPGAEWKRLEHFVSEWWAKNKVASYQPDFSRCVLLPESQPA